MATTKTKVVGNNFDPYLVGLQFTSEGGTPLFTIGNFQITTNLTPPPKRNFQLGSFSDPLTIENLGSTLEEATQLVNDNLSIYLNLNTENLLNFTLFGSFVKFIDVSLNQIIQNWPGSIYVFYSYGSVTGYTAQNYVYDPVTDESTFTVSTNFFYNNYGINFLQNASTFTNTSIPNSIKNLTVLYNQYEIFINNTGYQINGFTASTTITNGTCKFSVKGDPFNSSTNTSQSYHIKPIDYYVEKFFSSLDDFPRFLLNRNTTPLYTCNIYYEQETEDFFVLQKVKRFTWPVTDGYNLDRNTGDFLIYKQNLTAIAENYDEYRTDLMRRTLVTESISYFELSPQSSPYYPLNTTEKIDQLLTIYGREFDEIKKYIDGISFANVVSYDKEGNTPDALIKDLAYYLGWDVLSPMDENELFTNFIPTQSNYSGMTVGYTPAESEVEFWRRLILNSSFLWKSKGTRKPIEFLFEFINTPPSLINFNEYIYQAKQKLDVNKFKQILEYLYNDNSIEPYNIDSDGYPKVPVDTLNMYFQKGGGWYRETAGSNSQIDLYEGNNPHIGPYDGGQEYINKFRCLLNSFSGQTIKITDEYVEFTNLFSNYYNGVVDNYTGPIYADVVDINNNPTDCIIIESSVVNNPGRDPEYSVCGCIIPSGVTKAILISVKRNPYGSITCSGDTTNLTGLISSIPPCENCYAVDLNTVNSTVIFECATPLGDGASTQLVLPNCCQSTDPQYDLVWIENLDTGKGYCYYDDPCGNQSLQYLGQYLWADISNPNSVVVTNEVPEVCCLYRGGVYNEITGKCEAPL